MFWWSSLTDPWNSLYIGTGSRSVRARAYSCLASVHYHRRIEDGIPNSCNIDSLYRAAKRADECAALGLTTPTVLEIGQFIATVDLRGSVAPSDTYSDTARFTKLIHLWEAIDKRAANFDRFVQNVQTKASANPNAYRCALPGCGIEATSKSGLMRCAGRCPKESKPAYCSKQCQIQVQSPALNRLRAFLTYS